MNGVTDDYIDFDDDRPDDEPEPEPEPGDCPFCGGHIRTMPWFFHCNGCGFNWSTAGDIEFDRRVTAQTVAAPPDGRIDEHLAAVDAAELWRGEPLF